MSINKDQIKGRAEGAKGRTKEVIGKVVEDKEMEFKGSAQKKYGAVRAAVGDAKQEIANAMKNR